MSAIERRPDIEGRCGATYPREWGTPPAGATERRAWIEKNLRERGEKRGRRYVFKPKASS